VTRRRRRRYGHGAPAAGSVQRMRYGRVRDVRDPDVVAEGSRLRHHSVHSVCRKSCRVSRIRRQLSNVQRSPNAGNFRINVVATSLAGASTLPPPQP